VRGGPETSDAAPAPPAHYGLQAHENLVRELVAVGENFAALRQDPETTELEARRRLGYGIHGRRL
jgi:hypothetical protein